MRDQHSPTCPSAKYPTAHRPLLSTASTAPPVASTAWHSPWRTGRTATPGPAGATGSRSVPPDVQVPAAALELAIGAIVLFVEPAQLGVRLRQRPQIQAVLGDPAQAQQVGPLFDVLRSAGGRSKSLSAMPMRAARDLAPWANPQLPLKPMRCSRTTGRPGNQPGVVRPARPRQHFRILMVQPHAGDDRLGQPQRTPSACRPGVVHAQQAFSTSLTAVRSVRAMSITRT